MVCGQFPPKSVSQEGKWNLSQAHVTARASFSIWVYLPSVSDRARDAQATCFQESPALWRRMAPRPYKKASAETFVSACGLYRGSTLGCDSSALTCVKALP